MIVADKAHRKIARWHTGDRLDSALHVAETLYPNLGIGILGENGDLGRALRSMQYTVLMPLIEADLALFGRQAILYKRLP